MLKRIASYCAIALLNTHCSHSVPHYIAPKLNYKLDINSTSSRICVAANTQFRRKQLSQLTTLAVGHLRQQMQPYSSSPNEARLAIIEAKDCGRSEAELVIRMPNLREFTRSEKNSFHFAPPRAICVATTPNTRAPCHGDYLTHQIHFQNGVTTITLSPYIAWWDNDPAIDYFLNKKTGQTPLPPELERTEDRSLAALTQITAGTAGGEASLLLKYTPNLPVFPTLLRSLKAIHLGTEQASVDNAFNYFL